MVWHLHRIASQSRVLLGRSLTLPGRLLLHPSSLLLHPFSTLVLATLLISGRAMCAANTNASPTVGMEGRLEALLPVAGLEGRPVTDRSPVIVRVANVFPHGTLTRYDLRYVGLRPGDYDLREFLVVAGGATPTNLPPLPVHITGLLPPKHDGRLIESPAGSLPGLGGYRVAMIAVCGLWIAGLAVWFWTRPRPAAKALAAGEAEPPSIEERLRPLVESAARRELGPEGQAQLERLLLGYWRQKLGWDDLPMDAALARLRTHPEAGALLRSLESWLHRPAGTTSVDVAELLAPYRRHSEAREVRA